MSAVVDWVLSVMDSIGGPGIALAILLENVFPPIPSEVVLPLAGFTASQGRYGVLSAILWATAGSVLGALLLYWLGAAFGLDRLRAIARRMPLVRADDVDKADAWFNRHGNKAVLLGRLVPGVRSLVSIPAGVSRMPLGTFVALTALGSLVWNSVLIWAGYQLGDRWHVVEQNMGVISKVVYAILLVALAWAAVRLVRRSRGEPARL